MLVSVTNRARKKRNLQTAFMAVFAFLGLVNTALHALKNMNRCPRCLEEKGSLLTAERPNF
jgi:hypothetical protein